MIPFPASLASLAGRFTTTGLICTGWALTGIAWIGTTYADLRLEGPFGIGIGYEGWKPYAERMEAKAEASDRAREQIEASYRTAQAEAAEKALQARMTEQNRLSDIARKADERLDQARRDALADARAYIDRMRPESYRSASGGTVAAASGSDTGSGLQADPAPILDGFIVVPESDVLICTDNTVRLEAVQAWASVLNDPQ